MFRLLLRSQPPEQPFDTRDPGEAAQRSRIFWAVVCLDRIISCGTGRITTLPIWQIDVRTWFLRPSGAPGS